jgi:hypothetical protein
MAMRDGTVDVRGGSLMQHPAASQAEPLLGTQRDTDGALGTAHV